MENKKDMFFQLTKDQLTEMQRNVINKIVGKLKPSNIVDVTKILRNYYDENKKTNVLNEEERLILQSLIVDSRSIIEFFPQFKKPKRVTQETPIIEEVSKIEFKNDFKVLTLKIPEVESPGIIEIKEEKAE
ncbi:hypothetical protein KAH94_05365 [bacterium]|nr:hypothetical protein [bacterium]